jgi:hypothetical protein
MLTRIAAPTNHSKQTHRKDPPPSSAISRLLAAAVINENFRDLLLSDPFQALAQGFQGELFHLDSKDTSLILSIQTDNLSDFALQIVTFQEGRYQTPSREWYPAHQNALVLEAK